VTRTAASHTWRKDRPILAWHADEALRSGRSAVFPHTIQEHSRLGVTAAGEIAVHVLHTLDTIPERIR
jgi:hypothetical protein